MLDPVQFRALEQARHRPVRVSGFPGSGLSYLARAIAEDAARRGLNCLLVGASPTLDRPIGPLARPHRMHPVLAARASGPVAGAISGGDTPDPGRDPLALRAAVDPDSAAVALKLRDRAVEILERHSLDPMEIETSGHPSAPDPDVSDRVALAMHDARTAAAGIWRQGGAGRTLDDVIEAARGNAPGADAPHFHLVMSTDPGGFEGRLAELALRLRPGDAALSRLRSALDPWAWRPSLPDVASAYRWAARQADLFEEVAGLLGRNDGFDAAIADPSASHDAVRTLRVWRDRFPDRDERVAAETCLRAGREHRGQADGIAPFLERHGDRAIEDLRAMPGPRRSSDPEVDVQALRDAHFALRRLGRAAGDLPFRMAPASWARLLSTAVDDPAAADALVADGGDRALAARELREIREAFSALGYGDVLAVGDLRGRISGESVTLRSPPGPVRSAAFLDLLVPVRDRAGEGRTDEGLPIDRVRSNADLGTLRGDYDVIVVDDEASASDAVMDAIDGIGSLVHSIGVLAGDSDGFALDHPHRQRDAMLANVAAGLEHAPHWLGCPRGAGIVVRQVPEGQAPDLAVAARALRDALAAAGYDACVLDGDASGRADIVVAYGDECDGALVARAAGAGSDGAVILCRTRTWHARAGTAPADDSGLRAEGWTVVVDAVEGRILHRDGKSAVLAREPAWNDPGSETVVERVGRLAGLGWAPVVDWIGSPRSPAEIARLLSLAAVAPDPRMRRIMEGHSIGG